MTKAIVVTSGILLLFVLSCSILGRSQGEKAKLVVAGDVDLKAVEKPVEPPPPPPPPAPPVIEQKIAMKPFTVPKIVKEVREDEKPPEQKDLDDAKIGTVNVDGQKDNRA